MNVSKAAKIWLDYHYLNSKKMRTGTTRWKCTNLVRCLEIINLAGMLLMRLWAS